MSMSELEKLRHRMRLTQTELAVCLEVGQATVSRWETGARPVPGLVVKYLKLLLRVGVK
jgi:DNA-binding transcriptional regulator YiaG